jgi:hypothetical protein
MGTNSTAFSPLASIFERYKAASLAHQARATSRRDLGHSDGVSLDRLKVILDADARVLFSAAELAEARDSYLS